MPKVPRDVAPRELVRFLQARGWVIVREARHTILEKQGTQVAVPHHGPPKTGTVRAILNVANVSIDDAAREL